MVKEPRAGRVKTRLAKGVGSASASAFYRHVTAATLARLYRPREWTTLLAVAPDGALFSRVWPGHFGRVPQGGGDLGQRMQRLMDATGPGPTVIIGSDCPELRARHIRRAFRVLGAHDAVLGPASDGGYWLVGLKRFPRLPAPFGSVRWSSEHTLADTLANLEGLDVSLIETLDDVDEAADLARAGGRYARRSG